jgi:hypothetical protein
LEDEKRRLQQRILQINTGGAGKWLYPFGLQSVGPSLTEFQFSNHGKSAKGSFSSKAVMALSYAKR